MIDLIAGRYTVRAGFGAAFDADNLGGNMLGLGISLTRANLGVSVRNFDFTTGVMPSGLTFTRASTATYIGSDGLLKTAAVDEPRFDYDPITLACKGLLIEGSRTNLLTYSDQFDNAAWTKVRASISANTTVAPDGTLVAEKIVIDNTASTTHNIGQNISVVSGTTYTFSIFAKSAEFSQINLRFSSQFPAGNTYFDLSAGTLVNAGTVDRSGIVSIGGGWYRCVFTQTATSTGASTAQVFLANSGTIAIASANGSDGVFIWGAQLEAGAFPSSYIPTTSAAVTRAVDVCLMTGTNFSRWFNPLEGTIVAEFSTITNGLNSTGGNAFPHVYDIDQTAVNTSGHILLASAGYGPGVRAQTQSAGVSQAELTHAVSLGTGAVMRHAYAYKTNDFAACLNGGAVATDALGILISPDRLSLGSQNASGGNALDGHIRRIPYWPRRLSNARLQELTA